MGVFFDPESGRSSWGYGGKYWGGEGGGLQCKPNYKTHIAAITHI